MAMSFLSTVFKMFGQHQLAQKALAPMDFESIISNFRRMHQCVGSHYGSLISVYIYKYNIIFSVEQYP